MKMRQRRKIRFYPRPQVIVATFYRYQRQVLCAIAKHFGVSIRALANTRANPREPISDAELGRLMLGTPYTVIRPDLPIDPLKD